MYRVKRFSKDKILSPSSEESLGFKKGRKYDMDLNRLGRIKTSQDQLSKPNTLNNEVRKLSKELNGGI